nr:MAG TPA: hypothetical protein [Bacteriophage sp.]
MFAKTLSKNSSVSIKYTSLCLNFRIKKERTNTAFA